tara:strand:- start:252 stop:383 length:132 start_codon:yes stop_codon:yes gene_type:complete
VNEVSFGAPLTVHIDPLTGSKGISGDFRGFQGILRDFKGLYEE